MRLFFLFFFSTIFAVLSAQTNDFIEGRVTDPNGKGLENVIIYDEHSNPLGKTSELGDFRIMKINTTPFSELAFFLETYQLKRVPVSKFKNGQVWQIQLTPISYNLSEVIIRKKKKEQKNFRKLRDIEGMTINAGKKSEVVLLNDMTLNKVTNNARQIFSKVVGLTINEGSDGGLQLNVGGRGLNPNRTANFNTRQNGYDISADVLGYPESYYTPPSDGIEEIQIIRGAASLQYGTQFGGMINFKMKRPSQKKITITQHTSVGSYDLFSSFTELGGTLDKFSYYSFYNYKKGGGYRVNSHYQSYNVFTNLNYKIDEKNSLHFDVLKFYYLAKQPGGLTDFMFYDNPRQSNRERNWFRIDWNIINLRYQHIFTPNARFSVQFFGLQAERSALGFRDGRVSAKDPKQARDLLVGKFKNWGAETRFIQNYTLGNQKSSILIGTKYYQSANSSQQGLGSAEDDADFNFYNKNLPDHKKPENLSYSYSYFDYPNFNLAFFSENIFRINDKTTITPGLRIEKIKTGSKGVYTIAYKGFETTTKDDVVKDRNVFLLGLGISHKLKSTELYGNISQNYRSITFSDIHSKTPGFAISPDITDEKGFSSDIGIRGKIWKVLHFDSSLYTLYYGDKIGEYLKTDLLSNEERYRDNVGVALTYGFETLLDWDINNTFWKNEVIKLSSYINIALTQSKYIESNIPNIKGNQVEFVPLMNLKSGIEFGYKNFISSTQLTFVSSQYSDATNRIVSKSDNRYGIFGIIPSYYVIDFSASYKLNRYITLEGSIQNLTNHKYFTRRATGYPGPGIIPSEPINFIISLDIHL